MVQFVEEQEERRGRPRFVAEDDKADEPARDDPGLLERGANLASEAASGIAEVVTGSERGRGRLPELGSTDLGSSSTNARVGAGFLTTPDIEARKDILTENIPGVRFAEDEAGNTVVTLPDGRQAFLNAPGLSLQDFADLGSEIVKFLPAARIASAGRTLLGRIARGGTAAGATSAAEDLAAQTQGSNQGIRPGRLTLTAISGGGAEVAAPALAAGGRLARRAFAGSATPPVTVVRNGEITPEGREALLRAGLDPDEVPPSIAQRTVDLAQGRVEPGAAGGVATSERFGIPLTRGQTTRNTGQLAEEEGLRARGDTGGDIIRGFDNRQRERITEAAGELQEQVGPRVSRLSDDAEGGALIGGAVAEEADRLLQRVDEAFERASGLSAELNRDGLNNLGAAASAIRAENPLLDPELTPATLRALERVEDLTTRRQADTGLVTPSGQSITRPAVESRSLDEIEKVRRVLNDALDAAKNPADRRGVRRLKRNFDNFLDDAFENALFRGDDEALKALKEARGLRAEFGRRFQENTRTNRSGRQIADPGGRTVESIVDGQRQDEEVVNMIFGRANVFNSDNAVGTIRAIRRATNNSEQVNDAIKQLTLRRLLRPALNNDGSISAQKFDTSFERVMERNPSVVREIFSEDEIASIREFRDAVKRTVTPREVTNPSGTAGALLRTAQRGNRVAGLLNRLGVVAGLRIGGLGAGAIVGRLGRGIGGIFDEAGARFQAGQAVNPSFILPGRPSNTTIAATISAARQGSSDNGAAPIEARPVEARQPGPVQAPRGPAGLLDDPNTDPQRAPGLLQ